MTTEHTDPRAYTQFAALPSVRGLILGRNRRGDVVDLTTLRQWIRLNAEKFLVQKVDFWEPHAMAERVLALLEEASPLNVRLSLATTPQTDPALLKILKATGLFDVCLNVGTLDADVLTVWGEHCAALALPLRVRIAAGAIQGPPSDAVIAALTRASHVTIAIDDPFARTTTKVTPIGLIAALAGALVAQRTDVHLLGLPFCAVPASLWPCVTQDAQRIAGHQHYRSEAWDFALKMVPLSARRIHQAVEISLGQGASFHNLVDNTVLPWILEKPRWFFWLWFAHKLTRRLPLRRPTSAPLPEDVTHWEQLLANHEAERRKSLAPPCAACRLHRICDHPGEAFRRAYPAFPLLPVSGEEIVDPLVFRDLDAGWCDEIDADRRALPRYVSELAELARRRIAQEPPTREIAAESYDIQDHATHHMPASVRWFSFSTAELQSTVLARVSPPFTISLTVGGGIAAHVGFSFGRHARILCPMTAYQHQVTLHVDGQGRYVLLRDGVAVAPAAFHAADRVPERLGTALEPRIAMINVDGQIVTQTVLLWEGATKRSAPVPRHSVVIVCTRFSRRLQSALLALAHQRGVSGALEVIVGYVPGLDATDDVLDGIEAVYPDLAVVRVPFAPDRAKAKGFLINECTAIASGAWITLLDADIVLPPDYFTRLDALAPEVPYAAPDGRHMLDSLSTARVLMGDIAPWDHYNELCQQAGEYRHHESDGVPPGFCQSLRREVFEQFRYEELDHFEGSDWWFSKRVMEAFGPVARLDGMGVLHLEHGGSQWYGTGKQR